MTMTVMTIEVDTITAEAYKTASIEAKKKLQILMRFWLKDLADSPDTSLRQVMDLLSDRARSRGLTPEILETLLQDE